MPPAHKRSRPVAPPVDHRPSVGAPPLGTAWRTAVAIPRSSPAPVRLDGAGPAEDFGPGGVTRTGGNAGGRLHGQCPPPGAPQRRAVRGGSRGGSRVGSLLLVAAQTGGAAVLPGAPGSPPRPAL